MSYNGSGVFTANSTGLPVVTGSVISTTMFNAFTADVATGLTTALCKDGQSTPTANIPLGGFKLTGLGAPNSTNDALAFGQAATVTTLTASVGLIVPLTGLLKGNGASAVTAATAGTDYVSPSVAATLNLGLTQTGSTKQSVTAMAALDIDLSANDFFTKSISTNSTFTFSNATASVAQAFILQLTISSAAIPTWPASVTWAGGVVPTFGNGRSLIGFVTMNGGTTWTGIPGAINAS